MTEYILEPQKQVPVAFDVDVVVAGGGVTDVMTALATARYGTKTVMFDRFGIIGGNIGPGFISGGPMVEDTIIPQMLNQKWITDGIMTGVSGFVREFVERYATLGGGPGGQSGVTPRNLDIQQLQTERLDAGFYLGDRDRLRELGLG
jgi:hypothetical protein